MNRHFSLIQSSTADLHMKSTQHGTQRYLTELTQNRTLRTQSGVGCEHTYNVCLAQQLYGYPDSTSLRYSAMSRSVCVHKLINCQ